MSSSGCGRPARSAAPPPERPLARVHGRFHEISIDTGDIRASVQFYESLGFTQASTADTWPHPYGVLTDGRLVIGLHQRERSAAALTFVVPGLARQRAALAERGIELTMCRTGEEDFHQIGFEDPFGQPVIWIEARTYSPLAAAQRSHCGEFAEFSLPSADFAHSLRFWEPLGFVAAEAVSAPYEHLRLTSDGLNIAFHAPRTVNRPMLVFREPQMAQRIVRLRAQGIRMAERPVRGLDRAASAVLESPEGTLLVLLSDEG